MFYCHSSEDRIVLSHAMYWTMTKKMSEGRCKMSDVRNEFGKYFSLSYGNIKKRCWMPFYRMMMIS